MTRSRTHEDETGSAGSRAGSVHVHVGVHNVLPGLRNGHEWVVRSNKSDVGYHGVPSKTGAFHAEDTNFSGNTFTQWGGYSKTFPVGGYTTSVDVYLDISPPYMNGVGYRTTHGSIGPPPSTNRAVATCETSSSTLASTTTWTLRAPVPGSWSVPATTQPGAGLSPRTRAGSLIRSWWKVGTSSSTASGTTASGCWLLT